MQECHAYVNLRIPTHSVLPMDPRSESVRCSLINREFHSPRPRSLVRNDLLSTSTLMGGSAAASARQGAGRHFESLVYESCLKKVLEDYLSSLLTCSCKCKSDWRQTCFEDKEGGASSSVSCRLMDALALKPPNRCLYSALARPLP